MHGRVKVCWMVNVGKDRDIVLGPTRLEYPKQQRAVGQGERFRARKGRWSALEILQIDQRCQGSGKNQPSDRKQMAAALGSGPPALVVELRGGDVAVAEQVLDLDNIHVGIEQERGSGGPKRMRGVDAALHSTAIRKLLLLGGAWQALQVSLDQ